MDIALKNVTRFKTIMYEFSKGEDYRLVREYQDSSELILVIYTFKSCHIFYKQLRGMLVWNLPWIRKCISSSSFLE